MVAPQEEKILIFISHFGRTYAEVLVQTIYDNEQTVRSKISAMKKKKLIRLVATGLSKPRNAIVLTAKSKKFLEQKEIKAKENRGAISHIKHNILEQITFYHLGQIGNVKRTSVYHHQNYYYSVPDMVLSRNDKKYAIEVETTQKSRSRYLKKILLSEQDIKSDIYSAVLYVVPTQKLMISLANAMPSYSKVSFIDIDTMIKNIKKWRQVSPFAQADLIKIREEKEKKEEIKKLEKYHEEEEIEKRVQKEYERKNTNLKIEINALKNELEETQKENEKLKKELEEKEEIITVKKQSINELQELNEKYIAYIKKQKYLLNRSFLDKLFNKK